MAFEPKQPDARTSRILANDVREVLLAWAAQEAPLEACGLLFESTGDDSGAAENVTLRPVLIPNVASSEHAHRLFELDSVSWVAAEREATIKGEVLVGIWHSHPDGPPRPSVVDGSGAQQLPTDCAYVIVDLASVGSPAALTVWSWR